MEMYKVKRDIKEAREALLRWQPCGNLFEFDERGAPATDPPRMQAMILCMLYEQNGIRFRLSNWSEDDLEKYGIFVGTGPKLKTI